VLVKYLKKMLSAKKLIQAVGEIKINKKRPIMDILSHRATMFLSSKLRIH
jgi:hypothetical protein